VSTVEQIAAQVRAGELRAVSVIELALHEARSDVLGAFVHVDTDAALERAMAIDAAVDRGEDPGPLAGVPIAIKDNIAVAGQPLGCASRMLQGYTAPRSATAIDRLIAAGAVPLGRTNMDEFGMGSSGENSAIGPTRNPWDTRRVPGGSSSGSAAAVAAGIVPAALGSDTGGSVRQPAALCGIVGLKPSYGRISRSGLVAFGSSVDQIGPMSGTVRGAAALLEAMAGPDPLDSTAIDAPTGGWLQACDAEPAGLKLGLPSQCWSTGSEVEAMVRSAVQALTERGVSLVPIDLPVLKMAIPTYYLLTSAEASSNLSRFDGVRYGLRPDAPDLHSLYTRARTEGFGPEVQRRILLGTFALSAGYAEEYYDRADAVRDQMRAELSAALRTVDALAMPTSPTTAFPLGERVSDPVAMYLSDVFTTPPSLTGLPAISVPAGLVDGLPVGLQLVGRMEDEATVLTLAAAAEQRWQAEA
jgi:aspartyl-tRNA(Asn)/glutamyl-tRNA(Gln) amidotransferase subunit A